MEKKIPAEKQSSHQKDAHDVHLPFPEKYYADPLGLERYVVQEKTLFEWQSPSKVEKKRTQKEIAPYVLTIILILLVLLLLAEYFLTLVFAIMSLLLLVLAFTPPSFLRCQVTTIGIKVEEKYYYWEEVSQFWFEEKMGTQFLCFRNLFPNIQVIRLIIFAEDMEKIRTTIGTYLLFKKPQETFWDKVMNMVKERLPFDPTYFQF